LKNLNTIGTLKQMKNSVASQAIAELQSNTNQAFFLTGMPPTNRWSRSLWRTWYQYANLDAVGAQLIFLVLNQQVWCALAACDDLAVISNRAVFNEAGIDSLRHWFDLLLDLASKKLWWGRSGQIPPNWESRSGFSDYLASKIRGELV